MTVERGGGELGADLGNGMFGVTSTATVGAGGVKGSGKPGIGTIGKGVSITGGYTF